MSEQKRIITHIFEGYFNERNEEIMNELFDEDYTQYEGEQIRDLSEARNYLRGNFETFPDLHFLIHEIFEENNKVLVRWTATGTHRVVSREANITGMSQFEFENDKIIRSYVNKDDLGLYRQLGAIAQS